MKTEQLFHRDVTSCTDRDSLEHAATLLWRYDIGCLPVTGDDGRLVGMITDRDIAIAAFLQGAPLRGIVVGSVMSRELVTCRPDDDIHAVISRMLARQVRRLPVIDGDGRILGIISLNDLARGATSGQLPTVDIAGILVAISAPRPISTAA
ncbi:MAG: CBS domain-containing protein [Proteobacteria bacterium]|nr:CBS domain-containing protein [Pseudomonadota bacterium]